MLESTAGHVYLRCEVDQGSFHLVEILLVGIWGNIGDRENICEDERIRL